MVASGSGMSSLHNSSSDGPTGAELFVVGVMGVGSDGWSNGLGGDKLADADSITTADWPEGFLRYKDDAGATVWLWVHTGELCSDVVGVAPDVRESNGNKGRVTLGCEVKHSGRL